MCKRVSIVWGCVLVCGCAGPAAVSEGPFTGANADGSPRWVQRGSGAFEGEHGKAFYGVGVLEGVESETLARQTVDNRARAEIAKILDSYVSALMRDYQSATTAGGVVAEEQEVQSAQKTITEVNLRGVEIRDHWRDPKTGALYALAVLELDALMRSLPSVDDLSPALRDHMRDNAERAFDALDRELAARRGGATAAPPTPKPAPPPNKGSSDLPNVESVGKAPKVVVPGMESSSADDERSVRVGVRVSGKDAENIQSCLASRVLKAGFELVEGSSDVDFMVRAELRYQKAGNVGGTVMVKATVDVRLEQTRNRQTRAVATKSIKVGRPTLGQALLTASTQLCEQVIPGIVDKIRAVVR